MDITKTQMVVAILLLVCGMVVGSFAFPQVEEVEVIKKVPVPGPIKKVPVPGPVQIVEKEVENTEKIEQLSDELSTLKVRYEQLTDTRYVGSEVGREVELIQEAVSDFKEDYMYKLIRAGFKPSEISVVKTLNEEVDIDDVSRSIDGIQEDYEQVDVSFTLKAKYEDEDGSEFRFWDVEVSYDVDSEGREDVEVTAILV